MRSCHVCGVALRAVNRSGTCRRHFSQSEMGKVYRKAWYSKNREEFLAYSAAYAKSRPEKTREYKDRYERVNKDKIKEMRKTRLNEWDSTFARFKISADDFKKLHDAQQGKCAICCREGAGRKTSKRMSVDHCHETGVVRGLLCNRCNLGLGHFQDNVEALTAAVEYLQRFKQNS